MPPTNNAEFPVRDEHAFSFGSFRLLPGQRLLLEGDNQIRLGSRALDILAVLVEHAGRVVPREELIARVWPKVFVEESNLKIQVSALRRALGDGQAENRFIVTVPGRGYEFVAPVSQTQELQAVTAPAATKAGTHNLPLAITRMIGRDETVAALVSRLSRARLVTVVGPGGIGKTTVALAVAEGMVSTYEDGVWLIDLAPLGDPHLVPRAITTALGLQIQSEDPLPGLVASLGEKRMLLVLDNCEHVIDAAARLATALLRGAARISILATSREPLGVAGEREYRLRPLTSPNSSPLVTASEALAFPAVRLFVERATAVVEDFVLSDADAPLVVEICRRLDGLPLAIEFAAARVEVLGIQGLATHLNNSLQFLGTRRGTAMPRQRTMRAVIDWSYGLLNNREQVFFRHLAIFAGSFTVEAAATVAGDPAQPRGDAIDLLADLVAKSLVTADISGGEPRFRLFETTRAYALENLGESGELQAVARRHAEYYRDLFKRAETECDSRSTSEWLADYGGQIDNLRAALNWALSPAGDASIGVALAGASVPIWFEMSLPHECGDWMEKALDVLDAVDRSTKIEMVLQYALGYSLMLEGINDRARSALTRTSELAERLADLDYQLRALAGLASICHRLQDYAGAVALGRQAEQVVKASSDPIALSVADWILGPSLQLLGEYAEASTYAERTYLRTAVPQVRRAHIARLGRDSFISAGSTMALIHWTQGLPDRSAQTARNILADAETGGHPVSLCLALTWCGCIIPLRLGDLQTAERSIARLKDHAQSHGLSAYYANGLCFEGHLSAKRGDVVAAERLLRAGLRNLQQTQSETLYTIFLSGLAEVLMMSAHLDESLAAADGALQRTENSNAFWWMPEALRIKGEVLLSCKGDTIAAEDHFRRSLDLAHRQGALSWELRAATSLARLWGDQGRSADAVATLKPVYDRFTQGFDTADLVAAKRLVDELNHVGREGAL